MIVWPTAWVIMLFGIGVISLIRLGKTYFAEVFTLHEFHGNTYAKPLLHLESEIKQKKSWQISVFSFGLSGCLYFLITHCKAILLEIIAGVLCQKRTLLVSGIFQSPVRITSYKKYLHGRLFSLWKQITLTYNLKVFLCSFTLIIHWNCSLHFAKIKRIQSSPNIQQSADIQEKATK